MRRSRRAPTACLWLVLLGMAAGARAQQQEAPPSAAPTLPTWYAQALATTEIGINVTHFWSKGPKLRAETVILGRRIVTIVNGDSYIAYDVLLRRGIIIGRSAAAIARDAPDRRPFGRELEQILGQGGEKVGDRRKGRIELLRSREIRLRGSPVTMNALQVARAQVEYGQLLRLCLRVDPLRDVFNLLVDPQVSGRESG